MPMLSLRAEAEGERTPIAIVRQSVPENEPQMATPIELARQNGESEEFGNRFRRRETRVATRIGGLPPNDSGSRRCVDHCIRRQPVPAKRSKMATRIGLPQQNGGVRSGNGHHVLQSSVTACEKGHKWQLALDLLVERRKHSGSETGCGLRHSMPARKTTDGNSHWARSAGRKQNESAHRLNMPARTFMFERYAGLLGSHGKKLLCAPSRIPPLLRVEI
jgi:hypothetical protein